MSSYNDKLFFLLREVRIRMPVLVNFREKLKIIEVFEAKNAKSK